MEQMKDLEPESVHPLRAHRQNQGWSQEDVANHLVLLGYEHGERNLGATGAMVGRWERRERSPRPPYPRLLCLLFGRSATELGLAPSRYRLPSDTLDEVERRMLLRLLTGALAAPVLAHGKVGASVAAEAERLVHALNRPSGTDGAVASVVESGITSIRMLDDVSGPRVAVRPAVKQREIVSTLIKGSHRVVVKDRLTAAAGELSQLLGWLAYDMNDRTTSLSYLEEALAIAHQTSAHDLGAYVLGYRGVVEVAEGRPQQGLAFADAARSWAEVKASPATRSWLAVAEAEALAAVGDRPRAERALEQARTLFARSRGTTEPSWLYYYDQACLDGRIGSVRLTLGQAGPARQAITRALTTQNASMVRDRAWYLARLGQTYVLEGEVEEACRLASEALAIGAATRSDEVVLRVRELRTHLAPWKSAPMVRHLDDQLTATSSWCHPATA